MTTSAELHEMAEEWLNANMGDHWSPRHFDNLVALLTQVLAPYERVAAPTARPRQLDVERADPAVISEDEVLVPDGEGGFVRTKVSRPPC